jgi:AraC-like DNA-binding protein
MAATGVSMAEAPVADVVSAAPAPALRALIDGYRGYRLEGFPPGVHRGLPSRHMTFIVSIGDPIEVLAQTDPAQPPDTYHSVLSGLQATPALIADPGHQEGVAIELTPIGARVLLGMPARELWDTSLEFVDVAGSVAHELWERLQIARTWPERFAVCDGVLARLAAHPAPPKMLEFSWRALVDSAGTMPVGQLATASGYSRRHLTRRFRDEFGPGPKLAARIIRFDRARDMLARVSPFVTIGHVAAVCGYTDHAHMVRDVQAIAGCTPTDLVDELVPFVQDVAGGDSYHWAHDLST